jgi:serine acetyltransferase
MEPERHGVRRQNWCRVIMVKVGVNACVLGPAKVGHHVTIGAGAIVVGDLPDHAVAVGAPAKPRQ